VRLLKDLKQRLSDFLLVSSVANALYPLYNAAIF